MGVTHPCAVNLQPFIDSSVVPKSNLLLRFVFELVAFGVVLLCGSALIIFVIGSKIVFNVNAGTFRVVIYLVLNLLWALVFIILVQSFIRLRRRAKMYSPLTLEKLGHDTRDPILYLRSFYDQGESIWRTDLKSSEEIFASALKDIGPVVAVGKPKETAPPPGGYRIYFKDKDEDWQAGVKYLMSISQLVVIDAGFSAGLGWEVGAAAATVNPIKLILSFISWDSLDNETRQSLYESFSRDFKKLTGVSLPERLGQATFMLFGEDWATDSIKISSDRRFFWGLLSLSLVSLFGDASALAIKESLRLALKKRGFGLRPRQEIIYVCSLAVIPTLLGLLTLFITLINIRLFNLSI